ncbi:ABC transporter substrate-binding protein [Vagococcus vulneris]|uniref:SsuA/THI5-like domain-containing protein n=1 Tax=Vagococcus vulneris TaxID=1977869 RepID=A0A429ZXR9_9ENTE|nr:ABC transporter substrate-binding protein [Vagococcus vulneris]RST98616.1 hypothetical protein CBF37_07520 [Vagococcus vulneris]
MKKRLLALILLSVVIVGVLGACATKEPSSKKNMQGENKKEMSLSFGAMPAVDSLPVYIADKEGFFKDEGLNLDLQSFKSPKDRDAALSSGHLDGANTDLIALSAYRQGDLDVKIVSQSVGAFSVLTGNDSVKTLSNLKGKKIGYIQKQAPEYFLAKAIAKDNMTLDDVEFEAVPQIPVRIELTKNQKIDATVVPEPFTTIGKTAGLKELANSSELNIQTTVFGFKGNVLEENQAAVKAFYRAYDKAVDFINEKSLDDYYDVLIEKVGFTEEIKGEVKLPKYTHAKQIDSKQVKEAFEWSKGQGIYTKKWTDKDVMSSLLTK